MNVSVELTFSPLANNYESLIIDFIKELRQSPFDLIETPLSTQIYGDLHRLMTFLTVLIERFFKQVDAALVYMKLVNQDRKDYEPFDA